MTVETLDLEKLVNSQDVVVFIKGTSSLPQCGFSNVVVQIFDKLGVAYKDVNILEDMELRQRMKEFSDWPTFPQIYVKGEFIGGCDIAREMFQNGELQTLLQEKGIAAA